MRLPVASNLIRILERYSSGLSKAFADKLIRTAMRLLKTHSGPTGALRASHDHQCKRITAWSTHSSGNNVGLPLLNEDTARGISNITDEHQTATYIHVDDCVCLADANSTSIHADLLVDKNVLGLEQVVFNVSEKLRKGNSTENCRI